MVNARGHDATIHLAIEDASGDSAIVESDRARRVVHHGREFTLMTNDPPYGQQLELLSRQDFSHRNCDMPLPGNVNAIDRFQRAVYYRALLPKPQTTREAVAGVMAIMRNVSVPFGAPHGDFGVYNTESRTVTDLSDRLYLFELTTGPNVIWVEFDRPDLPYGGQPLAVDPYDETHTGAVTARFAPRRLSF